MTTIKATNQMQQKKKTNAIHVAHTKFSRHFQSYDSRIFSRPFLQMLTGSPKNCDWFFLCFVANNDWA